MPPPPYFKTHLVDPSSFKSAVNAKLDKPATSLFRLSIRLLQFAFALASGISYAIELHRANNLSSTNFIYTQVVFGLSLLTLIIDSVTVRYYRFTWIIEWALVILWIACFGVFYQVYMDGEVEEGYQNVDLGRMKNAVWCDLINALLWMSSALFSSVMCCSGVKAAIKSKLEKRRQRKQGKKKVMHLEDMETGTVGAAQQA
jgi:glucan phosphoethanolaminetransferase (alkaline phosphatase superfamily)